MKILKQLTVTNDKSVFEVVATWHHVDDPDLDERTGYTEEIMKASISLDECVRWAIDKLKERSQQRKERVVFTNLFTGASTVPALDQPIPLVETFCGWNSEGKL